MGDKKTGGRWRVLWKFEGPAVKKLFGRPVLEGHEDVSASSGIDALQEALCVNLEMDDLKRQDLIALLRGEELGKQFRLSAKVYPICKCCNGKGYRTGKP